MTISIKQVIEKHQKIYLEDMKKKGFFSGPIGNRIFDAHPYDINNGLCDCFATDIEKDVTEAIGLWLEEIDSKYEDLSHCVIVYQGRYYDAECPDGVEKVEELPFFKNKNKTRDEVIAEKARLFARK